jgi:hypothetical protein
VTIAPLDSMAGSGGTKQPIASVADYIERLEWFAEEIMPAARDIASVFAAERHHLNGAGKASRRALSRTRQPGARPDIPPVSCATEHATRRTEKKCRHSEMCVATTR